MQAEIVGSSGVELCWRTTPLPRTLRDTLPLRSHAVRPFDQVRARALRQALAHLAAHHPEAARLVGAFCRDVYWTKLRNVYQGLVPDFAAAAFAGLPGTAFLTDRALTPRGTVSLAEALVTAAARQRLFAGPPLFRPDFDPRRAPKVPVPWRHLPGIPFAFWPLDRALHEVAVLAAVRTLRPLSRTETAEGDHLAAAVGVHAAELTRRGRALVEAWPPAAKGLCPLDPRG